MNFKRSLSILLCVSLLVGNTMVSFADINDGNVNANAGGQQGNASKPTGSGNGSFKIPTNTGYRFTITDKNGNAVSYTPTEDGGYKKGSLDVYNSGVNTNKSTGLILGGCATDATSQYVYFIPYTDFNELIKSTNEKMPQWIDSNETLYGIEFREWILKKEFIRQDTPPVDTGNSQPSGGSTGGSSSKPSDGGSKKPPKDPGAPSNSQTYKNLKRYIEEQPVIRGKRQSEDNSNLKGWYDLRKKTINSAKAEKKITASEATGLLNKLYQNYQSWQKIINQEYKIQAHDKKVSFNNISNLFTMTSYAATTENTPKVDGEKVEDESKIANEENINKNYEAEKVGFAWNIINMVENGKYVFYMDGVAETANPEQDRIDGKRPGDIFIKNDYRLVVENTIQGRPQGYIKGKGPSASYSTLVYGTAHNWAVFGNSSEFRGSPAYSNTFGNHQRFLTRFLPKALVTEKPWATESGELVLAVPTTVDQWSIDIMVSNYKSGFGTQVYSSEDLGGQPVTANLHTYDITTNPQEDYFTEPSTGKDEGTTYPDDKRNKFNVVKYYIYEDDVTGEVTEISYYVTTNAPHTVIIDDEKAQTGFSLKEYFTSTDDWLPENEHEPSDYPWESLVKAKHKNGTYSGIDYTTVIVTPENPDVVLHILYTFTGKETPSGLNVIKIYKNESDEIIKTKGPDAIENDGTYVVENEDDYEYIETLISKNEPNVNVPEGSSTTNEVVEIPSDAKTLYVIYKENPQQIKLYSNELSYTYELKDLIKSRILFEILDIANAAPGIDPGCPGTHTCGDDDCSGHSCSHTSTTLTDSVWTLSVTDSYDYNNELSFIRDYSLSDTYKKGYATYDGGQKSSIKPNATFLLYRDKVSDLVTLYPKKNDSLSSTLSTLGIDTGSSSYTPHGDRITSELVNDKSFTNTLNTHFEYAHDRDSGLSWKFTRYGYSSHVKTGGYNVAIKTSPTDANKYYNNKNNVKEYYLLGQSNTGSEDVSDMRSDSFGTKYSYNKAYSSTSADLKFYPYHLMLYRAKNSNANAQNVYVTSENLSTMKVYNAVQLGVYKKNPINALLSSTQWSTHARSLAFSGNIDKKSVLPGGAVLDLDMGSKGDTELGIRLWQSCLRDEQVETVQQDGFNTSLSKAKEIANNYQSEVKDVIEGYGLVQWGTEGVQTDLNGVLGSGEELHNNTSLDWDNRSYNSSNDSKYYLKHNGSGSDRANFDVLDTKITKQVFYEISSDVNGDVYLKKNNDVLVSTKDNSNKDVSVILSNSEAKLLDDNTKLVSNYFSSIDRGLGDADKYDRTNSRKYNEAFDGVGVLLTELIFDVGFSDNSGHRTTVLDTLLTSTSDSKSDLYNFSDEKVRSFVFVTTENTTGSAEAESEGYIGTLSGDSTMNDLYTVLSDIQSFVYSKNFYTSNFNVTDLN